MIPGKRTGENCRKLIEDMKNRTGGRTDLLITTDAYSPYTTVIEACSLEKGERGKGMVKRKVESKELDSVQSCKPLEQERVLHKELCYATVQKVREKGRESKSYKGNCIWQE